jgi:hypothetical protein
MLQSNCAQPGPNSGYRIESGRVGGRASRNANRGGGLTGGMDRGHPAKMVCHWDLEARHILAVRALRKQTAVSSSRSLYIRRYRCSAAEHGKATRHIRLQPPHFPCIAVTVIGSALC